MRASVGTKTATDVAYLGNTTDQQAPTFTSAPTATFLSGLATTFTVTATGSPTFSETGALPAGVTFSANGILSGTATAASAGAYSITITATNSSGTAAQAFTLNVPLLPVAAVAAEGTDGQMYVQAPQLPAGWQPLGGLIVGPPAVTAAPNPNGTSLVAPLFIATGSNGELWMRSLTAGWEPVGPSEAYCIGSPAAVITSDGTLTVACEGLNRQLYYTTTTMPSSGLPTFTNPWTSLGGILSAGPAVAPVGGALTFFAEGINAQVYTNTGSGYTATPWFCVGSPAAALQTSLGVTTFACQGLDHGLWDATSSGEGWSVAVELEIGFSLTGSPACAGTSRQSELFYEARGPGVWELGLNGEVPLGGIVVGGIGATALD